MLQTWDILAFVARLRKEEIILRRTLAQSYKAKIFNHSVASFSGGVLATLYNKKTLACIFTVAVLHVFKENRSFFLKQ